MTAVHLAAPHRGIALEAEVAARRAKPPPPSRHASATSCASAPPVIGPMILGFLVLIALFADLIAPSTPNTPAPRASAGVASAPPCIHLLGCPADQPQHLLGLDGNFRDVFSRVVLGARVSLLVGIFDGDVRDRRRDAHRRRRRLLSGPADNFLMRMMDVLLAFPIAAPRHRDRHRARTGPPQCPDRHRHRDHPGLCPRVRSSVLSTRENDFVTASQALGESARGILTRRILPNSVTPLIVQGRSASAAPSWRSRPSRSSACARRRHAEWGSMIACDRNLFFRPRTSSSCPGSPSR